MARIRTRALGDPKAPKAQLVPLHHDLTMYFNEKDVIAFFYIPFMTPRKRNITRSLGTTDLHGDSSAGFVMLGSDCYIEQLVRHLTDLPKLYLV